MSLTFADMSAKVLRLLNDPAQNIFGDELIWDGVVAAHEAILTWIPKYAEATLVTSGSVGENGLYELPSDCYQLQSVQTPADGLFIPKATLAPKTARNISTGSDNDWIEYPYGFISLSQELNENDILRIYYFAFWNSPASDADQDFVIEVPPMAHMGMVYYTASHCLLPRSVNSAQIRQFNQRVDSGNPEHNPLKAESEWLLQRFYAEMKLMPSYVRVSA